jgi:hypothetical protein
MARTQFSDESGVASVARLQEVVTSSKGAFEELPHLNPEM